MYENELYNLLIGEIMSMYGIGDEDKAFKYFKLRYLIYNSDKKIKDINNLLNLSGFLMSELNIDTVNNSFIYKNQKITVLGSIYNIMENWKFRASLVADFNIWDKSLNKVRVTPNTFIEGIYNEILETAKPRAKALSNSKSEEIIILKHLGIIALNEIFLTKVTYPNQISNIDYDNNYNPFKRTLDEELNVLVNHISTNSSNLALINENILEEYIVTNIEKIEKGLKYVDKQVPVKHGRIDILAKDKDNKYVIIELKVEEDKEIIWQCLYYPDAIRERYKVDEVRMITLCPNYSSHMLSVLNKLDVEMYKYMPNLNFNQVKDIKVNKLI